MNAAHLHVMINHLPIVGVPFVAFLLAWGLYRKSREVIVLALWLGVAVSAATYPVYLTGEPAEEMVEELAWTNEAALERHEERAKIAMVIVVIAGVVAAVSLWRIRGGKPVATPIVFTTLFALVVSFGTLAFASWEGGHIRHDEFGGSSPVVDDHAERERDEH